MRWQEKPEIYRLENRLQRLLERFFLFLPDEKKDEAWEEMLQIAGKSVDQAVQKEILLALPSIFSTVLIKTGHGTAF